MGRDASDESLTSTTTCTSSNRRTRSARHPVRGTSTPSTASSASRRWRRYPDQGAVGPPQRGQITRGGTTSRPFAAYALTSSRHGHTINDGGPCLHHRPSGGHISRRVTWAAGSDHPAAPHPLSTSPLSAAITGRFMPIQSCRQHRGGSPASEPWIERSPERGARLGSETRADVARTSRTGHSSVPIWSRRRDDGGDSAHLRSYRPTCDPSAQDTTADPVCLYLWTPAPILLVSLSAKEAGRRVPLARIDPTRDRS